MVNKKEFIELISEELSSDKLSVSKKEAERFCSVITDTLVDVVIKGGKFRFLNFGTFTVVHRPERKGVNPRTGKSVLIPAKKVLKFKASSALVEKIANS